MARRKTAPTPESAALETGLPANPDAERFVLGAILHNTDNIPLVAEIVIPADFSIEKHRRIYQRMLDLHGRGDKVDLVTLANELGRRQELELCDGMSYLAALDDGLPAVFSVEPSARIVREKAALRHIIEASRVAINEALLGEKSPEDIIGTHQQQYLEVDRRISSVGGVQTADQFLNSLPHGVSQFLDPSRFTGGTPTGYADLDEFLGGGLHDQGLHFLAARPSMGKTSLGCNIVYNIASKLKIPCAVHSVEMSTFQLMARMACSIARVRFTDWRQGRLSREERDRYQQATLEITGLPIYWDECPGLRITELESRAARLRREKGVEVALVDYIQLMDRSDLGRKADDGNAALTQISRRFKANICGKLNMKLIVVSQLSRAPENRQDPRPKLSDLRESGALEQDADVIIFPYRPEVYKKEREDLRGVAELIVAKQRNGATGTVKLVFIKEYMRFESATLQDAPEENYQEVLTESE